MKKQKKRIQKGVAAIATNTSAEVPTAAAYKQGMDNKVKANFNMVFDHGSFTKGDLYDYSFNEEKGKYEVKTKQGRIQSFYLSEFNTFFTIAALENIKK